MGPVQPRLLEVLSRVSVHAPATPVVANVTALPNADAARVIPLLVEQVVSPVRWVECVAALRDAGVTRVVEVGPGKVLCGLCKRIDKGLELFNVEDVASLEKTLAALAA